MTEWVEKFKSDFYLNFIKEDRWIFLVEGLKVTLIVTFLAVLIGSTIGVAIAIIRSTYDKNINEIKPGPGKIALKFFNGLSQAYLAVIRGTPVTIQLLIIYYVILASSTNKMMIAVLAFGINSGAYMAEIFRSGIMSIDEGQFEAGRSLGFNYSQTMKYIVLPQAFKNSLPTLANEFIVLLKETSVSGFIALNDLTKGGDIIRSRTNSPLMPLVAVALIYFVLVMFFTWLVAKLERRLRSSEK